jgi:hypothetical protein
MRPIVRMYVALVLLAAVLLAVADASAWDLAWIQSHLVLLLVLVVLCAVAEHVVFQIHSGWTTHAGTVPHLALAVLVSPGVACFLAAAGMLVYVVNRRQTPLRGVFNTAVQAICAGAATWVVTAFGGTDALLEPGLRGPLAAIAASAAYYIATSIAVGGVIALDQRRSLLRILRGQIGMKTLVEIGLGLVGVTFGILALKLPTFAAVLVVPASLVFLTNRAIDRAAAQARNLSLTNTVGRAVAGTLSLDQALEAITDAPVRETLRLAGLAVVPLEDANAFGARVATHRDEPVLRRELAPATCRSIGSISILTDCA